MGGAMIAFEFHPAGTVLPVRAHAGARKAGILGQHDGQLKVSVSQVAERGNANRAIAALLSKSLRIPLANIELLSGATNAHKRFLISGQSVKQLCDVIARFLGEG